MKCDYCGSVLKPGQVHCHICGTDADESPGENTHYAVACMCLPCSHRWMGVMPKEANLFTLECPICQAQESFGTFLPNEYLEEQLSGKH